MKIVHPNGMSTHEQTHCNGWTLPELVVTLAIIGIVTTLAMPSFDDLSGRLSLRSASQALASTLRSARHRAMSEGRPCTVRFDPAGHGYLIDDGRHDRVLLPSGVRFGAAAGVLGPPSRPAQPAPADGVSFRGDRITFLPDGTLSPGPGTIYLSGRRRGEATLAISLSMAGHPRRYRWEGQRWTAW